MTNERFKRLSKNLECGLGGVPAYRAESGRVRGLVEEALEVVNEVLVEKFGRAGMGWPRVRLELAGFDREFAMGAPLPIFIRRPCGDREFATLEPLRPVGWGSIEDVRVRWVDDAGQWIWYTSRGADALVAIFEVVVGTAAVAWLLERSAQHEGREGLEGLGS